jgi:hypothetical protein
VAFIHDETDGLGFYAEFGLVAEAFADPDLVRRRRWREQVLSYLDDDSVEPMVLRRLADRDLDKASAVFRRVLKRPQFEWSRDGEEMLREATPAYSAGRVATDAWLDGSRWPDDRVPSPCGGGCRARPIASPLWQAPGAAVLPGP